ncbi:unknown [Clostridium sp. CAG:58]|nr:unknown [Clostridium sp. CAG:58]
MCVCVAHRLLFLRSAVPFAADDLVDPYVCVPGDLQVHLVFSIHILDGSLGNASLGGRLRFLGGVPVFHLPYPVLIVGEPDAPLLLLKLGGIAHSVCVRLHAPVAEEVQKVLPGRSRRQPHQHIVLIGPGKLQLISFRSRCRGWLTHIGIHSGKDQIFQLLFAGIKGLEIIASHIVGQMELPVHGQLHRPVRRLSPGSRGGLFKYVLVLEPQGIIGIPGLGQQRIVVIGHLCHRVGPFVDLVADLMGKPPAEQAAGLIPSLCVRNHGLSVYHFFKLGPLDADVEASGVHEGTGKHPLVADIQTAGRYPVVGLGIRCRA